MAFMVVTKYQRDEQYFEFFIEVVITYNKNKNIKIKNMVAHHYAVDVFMINFPVLEMPYVSCIKHVINLTELQKGMMRH